LLWLVVGMAYFRIETIAEVSRWLNICAEGLVDEKLIAKNALIEAYKILGQGFLGNVTINEDLSVTLRIVSMAYKYLQLTVHYSESMAMMT
jgi:hypothetical protein